MGQAQGVVEGRTKSLLKRGGSEGGRDLGRKEGSEGCMYVCQTGV